MSIYLITERAVSNIGPIEVTSITAAQLNEKAPTDTELFLIEGANLTNLEKICRSIRQNPCPAVYLRPIIAINCLKKLPGHLDRICDGQIADGNLTDFTFQHIKDIGFPINKTIEALPDFSQRTNTNIAFKILRYLLTREIDLTPYRSSLTIYGLHYPEIEIFLGRKDESIFNILDFLEEQRLLYSSFFEKTHICNQCRSSFLNFQEVCPQCSSADLHSESLIHHFSCAHVAPEPDFKQGPTMVCPKCSKQVTHLGVDYDRPSTVFECNSCQFTSQDPLISTTCFHCGAKSTPEDLIIRTIKSYEITGLAENAAVYGLDTLFKRILSKEIKILPLHAFKTVLGLEIERIKRYKISTSSLVLFQLTDMDKLYLQLGRRTKDIFGEMSLIVKSVLRTSDITTSLNESTFLSLMPETPIQGAEIALTRLKENFVALFESNLQRKIDIHTNAVNLSGDDTMDTLIETLINHAAS